MGIADGHGGPLGCGKAFAQGPHARLKQGLHRGVVAPRIPFQHHGGGNGIANTVALDFRAGHHGGGAGVDGTAHDGLQPENDLGRHHEGINAHVGPGGVPASPGDADLKVILRGHDASGAPRKVPQGEPGHVVEPENRIHREALEKPVRHHGLRPPAVLLRGLKDETDGTVEISALGEERRRPEHHGHVPVVTAAVHTPGMLGGVGRGARFRHGQRIHIGAEANHAGTIAAAKAGHESGSSDAAVDRKAQSLKLGAHEGCRTFLLKAEFGLAMETVAPSAHLPREIGGHGALLGVEEGGCQASRRAATASAVAPTRAA